MERISSLKEKIRSPKQKILNDPNVKDTLRRLHDDFVLVLADKDANNAIVVCKKYYIETLIKELGINATNISPNSTYIPTTDSFDEILKSHCKFIESVGLEMSEEDKNLLYLYWTLQLHKVPFKHHFIAGSSKCTTKDLSCLLTKVLTTVKDGLIRYNNTKTSHNGVNSMWIVKNSTNLLSSLDQLDVRTATTVQTYDFSTLYTSIPHNLFKFRITALIHNSFKRRNGSNRYTHIKITSGKGYFLTSIYVNVTYATFPNAPLFPACFHVILFWFCSLILMQTIPRAPCTCAKVVFPHLLSFQRESGRTLFFYNPVLV